MIVVLNAPLYIEHDSCTGNINIGVSRAMQIAANVAAVLECTCDIFLCQDARLGSIPLQLISRN